MLFLSGNGSGSLKHGASYSTPFHTILYSVHGWNYEENLKGAGQKILNEERLLQIGLNSKCIFIMQILENQFLGKLTYRCKKKLPFTTAIQSVCFWAHAAAEILEIRKCRHYNCNVN
jgi:hypothetical protein